MLKFALFLSLILLLITGCGDNMVMEINEEPYSPPELIKVFNQKINDAPIVTIGIKELCLATSFKREYEAEILEFTSVQGEWPIVMKDQFDRKWNIFGKSETTETLTKVTSSFGYWFAWSSIFPGVELFGKEIFDPKVDVKGNAEWDIPQAYVFKGANFDVFESLVYPEFLFYDQKNDIKNGFFLDDEDPVIVVESGENVRVYPHKILYYHEIVNDSLNGQQIAVIFSPFTATSTVWNREIEGRIETFGSSGMIYNNNILPFDRNSESYWSQMLGKSVHGFYRGVKPEIIPFLDTKWSTVKELYDSAYVLSPEIGSDFDYQEFPFKDYRTNHDYLYSPGLLFEDSRLKRKDIVFGISLDDEAIAFTLDDFD